MKQSQRRRQQRAMQDKVRHFTDEEIREISNRFLAGIPSMGDDTHIENHVPQLCITDGTNHMESIYIDKKKQVELLQTEVARLNATIERQKAEMAVMQARIDELTAENAGLHQAATTNFKNQNHYMDLYHKLVCELYPYALDLGEPVACKGKSQDYIDGYNRSGAATSVSLLEMMQDDKEYICMQCDILFDGVQK